MSRDIDLTNRVPFFPRSDASKQARINKANEASMKRNDAQRTRQLQGQTSGDAKVEISDAIKDFSRIKKAVDAAPPIDNTEKIAKLKSQIQKGEYQIDYDALADRMLSREF